MKTQHAQVMLYIYTVAVALDFSGIPEAIIEF